MNRKFFTSPNELRKLYYDKKLSTADIANKFNVDKSVIFYWMDKYGICRRSRSEAQKVFYQKHPSIKAKTIRRLKKISLKRRGHTPWWRKRGLPNPSQIPSIKKKISLAHKALVGERHPKWKGRFIRVCQGCGREFKVRPYRKDTAKFCSRRCAANHREYDSLFHERRLRACMKKPTKPEQKFIQLCQENNLPYRYTGNGSFWIGNINPDFIEIHGKTIAVEIFGDYWHSPLLNPRINYSATYYGRKETLSKHGWELIVFWESELNSPNAEQIVLNRLKSG